MTIAPSPSSVPVIDARNTMWLRVVLVISIALGVFFRLYHLDGKVFWEDEILGVVHMMGYTESEVVNASPQLTDARSIQHYLQIPPASAGKSLGATVQSLALEDPQHPPAYYILGRLWAQMFGSSAAAIRTLPALFGILVLPCVYFLSFALFASTEAALFAVALVALSPFYVLYAQEAREYSLWTLATLLNALLFLRASRSPASRLWIAYALGTAACLYIYPLTGLVTLGCGLYLFLRDRCRFTRTLAAYALSAFAACLLFAPWLAIMRSSRGLERGMSGIVAQKLTPGAIVSIFARDLRFPYFDLGLFRVGPVGSTAVNGLLTIAAVALSVYALVVLVRRQPFARYGFIVVAMCLSMTPLLLQDIFVHGRFVYQARYFIPLLLGIQLAVGALFARGVFASPSVPTRRVWSALFGLVLTGELLSCVAIARADTWWNKDYERSRLVAQVVNSASRPIVIADASSSSILALGFYLDPNIPVHVNMQCTQCSNSPTPSTDGNAPADYGSVFWLRRKPVSSDARNRWINPATFPPHADPLNMFGSI